MQHTLSLHRKIATKKERNYDDEREREEEIQTNCLFRKRKTLFCSTIMCTIIGMVWCGFMFSLCVCSCVLPLIAYFFRFDSRCGISIWNQNQTKRNESNRIEFNPIQSKTSTTHNKLNVIHFSVYQVFYWLGFTIILVWIKLRIYANCDYAWLCLFFCCF